MFGVFMEAGDLALRTDTQSGKGDMRAMGEGGGKVETRTGCELRN